MRKIWIMALAVLAVVFILMARLYLVNRQLPPGIRFIGQDLSPITWSKDSKSLFYFLMPVRDAKGKINFSIEWDRKLYRYDISNGTRTTFALPKNFDETYDSPISPDGHRIAFVRQRDESSYDVLTNELGTSQVRTLYHDSAQVYLSRMLWSNVKSIILVLQDRKLMLLSDNNKLKTVLDFKTPYSIRASTVIVSHDGNLLVWQDNQDRYHTLDLCSRYHKYINLKEHTMLKFVYLSKQMAIIWRKKGDPEWFEMINLKTMASQRLKSSELVPNDAQRAIIKGGKIEEDIGLGIKVSPDLSKCSIRTPGHYDYAWNTESTKLFVADIPKKTVHKLRDFAGRTQ